MKSFLIALLAAPLIASAKPEPISLSFDNVSLVSFSQATYKAILRRDFVISPEVVAMDRRITVNVKKIDASDLPRFVESLLMQQGVETTLRDGVYYLELRRPDAVEGRTGQVVSAQSGGSDAVRLGIQNYADGADGDDPGHDVGPFRKEDDDSIVYDPINRPGDFLIRVIHAGFGKHAAVLAGHKLVLTGSQSSLQKMQTLLGTLDSLPKTVDVSASWIEVTETKGEGRGIALAANVLGTRVGFSIGAVSGGGSISVRGTRFDMVVDALNSDGRFKQISNSRITGDEQEKLNLTVGDETPTVSSSGKDSAGNPVQNVVYRPSGVIVEVQPQVLASGRIRLSIDGQISSFKATSTGVVGSPTLVKRQIRTAVTVGDEEVLVIGGLNDSRSSSAKSHLSFLPASWSARSVDSTQTDLILVLSARVVKL